MQEVRPYGKGENKKSEVEQMFDNISSKYDFLNRLLSVGIDRGWRRKMIQTFRDIHAPDVLDVATGTADVAIDIAQQLPTSKIVGLDLSEGMLSLGRKKVDQKNLSERINLIKGDSENMPFEDERFDVSTVAFGIRNFQQPEKGLAEMHRCIKKNGKIIVLEFSKPKVFPIKQLFNTYFKYVLPLIGRFSSKDPRAYTYLYESVQVFPERENFVRLMEQAGFKNCTFEPLTFGICCLYIGEK